MRIQSPGRAASTAAWMVENSPASPRYVPTCRALPLASGRGCGEEFAGVCPKALYPIASMENTVREVTSIVGMCRDFERASTGISFSDRGTGRLHNGILFALKTSEFY